MPTPTLGKPPKTHQAFGNRDIHVKHLVVGFFYSFSKRLGDVIFNRLLFMFFFDLA